MTSLLSTKVVNITHRANTTAQAPSISPTINLKTVITFTIIELLISEMIKLANKPFKHADMTITKNKYL